MFFEDYKIYKDNNNCENYKDNNNYKNCKDNNNYKDFNCRKEVFKSKI